MNAYVKKVKANIALGHAFLAARAKYLKGAEVQEASRQVSHELIADMKDEYKQCRAVESLEAGFKEKTIH